MAALSRFERVQIIEREAKLFSYLKSLTRASNITFETMDGLFALLEEIRKLEGEYSDIREYRILVFAAYLLFGTYKRKSRAPTLEERFDEMVRLNRHKLFELRKTIPLEEKIASERTEGLCPDRLFALSHLLEDEDNRFPILNKIVF